MRVNEGVREGGLEGGERAGVTRRVDELTRK